MKQKLTIESFISAGFPLCKPDADETGLSEANFVDGEGMDLGEILDSGNYKADNPFVQLLADVIAGIRGKQLDVSKENPE